MSEEHVESMWNKTKKTSGRAWDKTKEFGDDVWEKTKEFSHSAWKTTKEAAEDLHDVIMKDGKKQCCNGNKSNHCREHDSSEYYMSETIIEEDDTGDKSAKHTVH